MCQRSRSGIAVAGAIYVLACLCLQDVETITYKIPLVYSSSVQSVRPSGVKRSVDDESRLDNLRGKPGQGYYIAVDIGNPPQRLNVLVDTGSSNFAIASSPNPLITKYFHPNGSQSFSYLGTRVYVPYTQGNWEGPLGSDEVCVPSAHDVSVRADLACIEKSERFFINGSNWQGILGLAYPAIARPNARVTPFFNRLVSNRSVSDVFSLQLCGQSGYLNGTGGTMIIGGIDPKLYTGKITYAPLHREWYYEIILTSLAVGDVPIQVDCSELNMDKTIVDSGTTNLRLPRKIFSSVVQVFKRQVNLDDEIPEGFWTGESVMCWAAEGIPWDVFPRFKISIAHSWNDSFMLSIPPQQYLREVGEADSPSESLNCFKFAINPSDSGTVLGTVVMEGFYLVFDRQNKRIGFAQSTCVSQNSETSQAVILGPFPFSDPLQCTYVPPAPATNKTLVVVAYTMAGFCIISLVPLFVMFVQWLIRATAKKRRMSMCDTAVLFDDD